VGFKSSSGAFQALRGFLQLALESIDLLRYIIELLLSQRSCPCDLLNSTIRSAMAVPIFTATRVSLLFLAIRILHL